MIEEGVKSMSFTIFSNIQSVRKEIITIFEGR